MCISITPEITFIRTRKPQSNHLNNYLLEETNAPKMGWTGNDIDFFSLITIQALEDLSLTNIASLKALPKSIFVPHPSSKTTLLFECHSL